MGDFNIDVLDTQDSKTKRFADVLRSYCLTWSIKSPTRVAATTKTAIDNIITNIPDVETSVVITAVADHWGQEAVVSGHKPEKEPQARCRIRETRPSNIALLNSCLEREDWASLNLPILIEEKFSLFQNTFNHFLNTCCPIKEIKIKQIKKSSNWITKGILVSREKLKFFSEINKKTSSVLFKEFFKRYKRTYRKVIKAAKAYDVRKSILTSSNVSKTTWGIINRHKNVNKQNQVKLKVNDRLISEPLMVAEEFNNFFTKVADRGPSNPGPQSATLHLRYGPVASMALAPVTEEEVARVIQQFPPKKSNDITYTSMWLIKKCSRHIVSPLTKLINASFEEGCFPSILKPAKVTPIFKKGDIFSVDNYRPISILPAFSKIFEKLFLVRLIQFLEKHNFLSEDQFGFRKGKSTIDAVVSLVDMVVEGLEARKHTLGVFLDLSKAFDCVDHGMLLNKLESHGIRGVPHSWLKSFLCDRSQTVQISSHISGLKELRYGVPQGSILSPLLFLIYVNDIGSSLQHGRLVKYADDTTLCINGNSKNEIEIHTFQELNMCLQSFNEINLKANPSKSNFINFCLRHHAETEYGPGVMLGEKFINEVYSTKFLGIYLDRGLTWNTHIEHICSKLSSGIFALRNLSKYCPTQLLITAYYGLIYPHLSYGVALWGACSSSDFIRLFRLQKKAVRIIAKLKRRESCKPAFKELQLLTLPCLYILETVTYCMSKCTPTRGRDVHHHNTRGRDNLRTGQHRTAVFEHLPSQAGVQLVNKLPDSFKNLPMPKALKTHLKRFLASRAFYNVDEFLACDWETINLV